MRPYKSTGLKKKVSKTKLVNAIVLSILFFVQIYVISVQSLRTVSNRSNTYRKGSLFSNSALSMLFFSICLLLLVFVIFQFIFSSLSYRCGVFGLLICCYMCRKFQKKKKKFEKRAIFL